jgi:hypothetical protein
MLDRYMNESISNLYRSNGHIDENLHKTIDDHRRDTQEQFNQTRYEISHRDESMHRRVDELNSYVDRRFDKLVDTYFAAKETKEQTKKLIKG